MSYPRYVDCDLRTCQGCFGHGGWSLPGGDWEQCSHCHGDGHVHVDTYEDLR